MKPPLTATTDDNRVLAAPPLPDPTGVALFLDIDGTLLEFSEHWGGVVVDPELTAILKKLANQLGGALALISGRAVDQIDALFNFPRIAIAGLHGAQIRDADGEVLVFGREAGAMTQMRERARELVAHTPGVLVEEKLDAMALHYRGAPDAAALVEDVAKLLLHEAGPDYAMLAGNHVMEIRPAGSDKGTALTHLMSRAPFAARQPLMIGDDITDEYAFVAAQAFGGAGVVVGPRRPTKASFSLADPQAARAWLASFSSAIPTPNDAELRP
jgi:trehalose 6-phosphate phosphatase